MALVRSIGVAVGTAACLAAFASCLPSQRSGSRLSAAEIQDEWTKREWISKVARVLGGGNHAISDEKLEELAPLSREEVVDRLMTGVPYSAALLDFLDYYSNTKAQSNGASPNVENLIGAYTSGPRTLFLGAAAAIQKGSDFFVYFDQKPGKPTQPLFASQQIPLPAGSPSQDEPAMVNEARSRALADHDFVTSKFEAPPPEGQDAIKVGCEAGFASFGGDAGGPDDSAMGQIELTNNIRTYLRQAGLSFEGSTTVNNWYEKLRSSCNQVAETLSLADYIAQMKAVRVKMVDAFDYAAKFNHTVYKPKDLTEVELGASRDFNVGVGMGSSFASFSLGFGTFPFLPWGQVLNSSTNFNRKRSAYMLRTYFCDDLTPISVVANDNHAEGQHGSDPGCQSCHYKLDPMGGFFRERQAGGSKAQKDETGQVSRITFDDGLTIDGERLKSYMSIWKAPANAGHEWNVGYIRSTTKPELNFFGETLEDLYAFMPKAPEVKQCLVRRLAEYFVGKNQVFDGEWLDSLAKQIPSEGHVGAGTSGKAVSNIIKTLVLSNTFAEPDPSPSKCYDFAPGTESTSLPCEIAWTLKTNCESCHKGESAAGRLDLFSWKSQAGGDGFVHLDDEDAPIDRKVTFARIKERLETTKPNKRMPKNREMTATDRARLFKWVDSMINTASTEPAP